MKLCLLCASHVQNKQHSCVYDPSQIIMIIIIIIIIIIVIITIYLLMCECSKARGGPVILVTGRRLFLGQLHQQHHSRHDYDCHHHWHLIVILGTRMVITGLDDHLSCYTRFNIRYTHYTVTASGSILRAFQMFTR